MKTSAVITLILSAMFSGSALADSGQSSAPAQIQPILEKMSVAANAHDTKGFLAAFLHQPTLVFVFNGRVIHGWNALYKQQLEWWRHGKSDAVYTQTGPTEFKQLSAAVVLTTRTLTSRRTLPDGKISTGSFAVSDIWQKLPQGWRIVYSHESWAR